MPEIGLFPLSVVLLPTERVPLHIFETRYKELINTCLAQDAPFGMVLVAAEQTHEIGTYAQVVQVL
ncbi:MAG: LON peptidase substrate-binding domain-containing protein, partial [Actinomycetota bacterium]